MWLSRPSQATATSSSASVARMPCLCLGVDLNMGSSLLSLRVKDTLQMICGHPLSCKNFLPPPRKYF